MLTSKYKFQSLRRSVAQALAQQNLKQVIEISFFIFNLSYNFKVLQIPEFFVFSISELIYYRDSLYNEYLIQSLDKKSGCLKALATHQQEHQTWQLEFNTL